MAGRSSRGAIDVEVVEGSMRLERVPRAASLRSGALAERKATEDIFEKNEQLSRRRNELEGNWHLQIRAD